MRILIVSALIHLVAVSSVSAADRLVFSTFENAGVTMVPERVMREVYKRLGYEIEIRQLPGARANLSGYKGMFDGELVRLAMVQEEFGNLIMVPTPIHQGEEVVFTKNIEFTDNRNETIYTNCFTAPIWRSR